MIFNLLQAGPGVAISFLLAIVIGITVHEFAHALAGYLQGDMTAKNEGRLTLSPFSHIDPFGMLMLLFAGFGWGRPTPYNPHNLASPKWGPLIVALAGPISNLVFVVLSFGMFMVLAPAFGVNNLFDAVGLLSGQGNLFMIFLVYLYVVSIMLMLFNLLPIPPLDGSQIVFTLLPSRFNNLKYFLAKNGPLLLFALIILDMVTNIGFFNGVISYFISLLFNALPS